MIGIVHAVFDVTERVRAQERLALVNDASSKIGGSLDVLDTAQELTDLAVPAFADHAYVNLLDPVFGGEEPTAGPIADAVPLRRAASSSVPGGRGRRWSRPEMSTLSPPGRAPCSPGPWRAVNPCF